MLTVEVAASREYCRDKQAEEGKSVIGESAGVYSRVSRSACTAAVTLFDRLNRRWLSPRKKKGLIQMSINHTHTYSDHTLFYEESGLNDSSKY